LLVIIAAVAASRQQQAGSYRHDKIFDLSG